MRRGTIVMLAVIGLVAFVATAAVAIFIPWLPTQAAKEREGIDFVFWLATWICVFVFAVVAAIMATAVIKFRARPDDDSDGAPIHGHTGLEIVWTAIPTLLVVVLGIASAVVLAQNDKVRGAIQAGGSEEASAQTGTDPNRVKVTAQQFAWNFEYPNGARSGNLTLPVGRSTVLELTALDVIHSFFVPEFGQKMDAVPGIVTKLVITPTKTGEYELECTELCGLGHALMRTRVAVVSGEEYRQFLAEGTQEEANGEAIFAQNCASCHTFEPAGSTGQLGPGLDALGDRAAEEGQDPAQFVRESIVDPDAVVHEDFSADVMPENYEEQLSEEQLDALVQYLLGEER